MDSLLQQWLLFVGLASGLLFVIEAAVMAARGQG